jgi:hypothetical protein
LGVSHLAVELRLDGRQSETAFAVQRGVCRLMRDHGFATLPEFTLATGRRADVIAIGSKGAIWIIEIKSSVEDFRVDQKWPEYREFCDQFFFAIPQTLAPEIIPFDAGLIIADNWGAEIIRQPDEVPMYTARRKSVTLDFARAAAQRLHSLYDP